MSDNLRAEITARAWGRFGRWLHRWRIDHEDDERTDLELLEQEYALRALDGTKP